MHEQIDASFDSLVKDLQQVLAYRTDASLYEPSEGHPFGKSMSMALDAFLEMARRHGFTTRNLDNRVGIIDTSTDVSLPLYGIMCHLDVVPSGDESLWDYPPYGGVVDQGRIYGRGSLDDKGPAVAALYAMKAIRDTRPLDCRFRLIVGLDEETGLFSCIKRYKETEEIPLYSFSPDGAFPLINAEKGILRLTASKTFDAGGSDENVILGITGGIRTNIVPAAASARLSRPLPVLVPVSESIETGGNEIRASGIQAHVKQPWEGKNAILLLLACLARQEFVSPLGRYVRSLHALFREEYDGQSLGIACEDAISGPLTCSLSVIDADERHCDIKIDVRYPVSVDGDAIVERLRTVFQPLGATVTLDSRNMPLHVLENDPFLNLLLSAYQAVTGEKGKPLSTGGGTYCRDMPRSVSFGMVFPGDEPVAHMVNEYVGLECLRKATHIFAEALYRINAQHERPI